MNTSHLLLRISRQRAGTIAKAAIPALLLATLATAAVAEPWTLDRFLDSVRANDPGVRAAQAEGDAGRAQAALVWAMLSPHVTVSSGFTRTDDPAVLFSQKLWQGRFGMADFAKSRTVAENMLTAHPDMVGMFASNESSTVGATQALKSRDSKVKLVGFADVEADQAAGVMW